MSPYFFLLFLRLPESTRARGWTRINAPLTAFEGGPRLETPRTPCTGHRLSSPLTRSSFTRALHRAPFLRSHEPFTPGSSSPCPARLHEAPARRARRSSARMQKQRRHRAQAISTSNLRRKPKPAYFSLLHRGDGVRGEHRDATTPAGRHRALPRPANACLPPLAHQQNRRTPLRAVYNPGPSGDPTYCPR